jgi:hypothetical protein
MFVAMMSQLSPRRDLFFALIAASFAPETTGPSIIFIVVDCLIEAIGRKGLTKRISTHKIGVYSRSTGLKLHLGQRNSVRFHLQHHRTRPS